jgi:hypothetical protein
MRVENARPRQGDPPVLIGNADRARKLLGWTPPIRSAAPDFGRLQLDQKAKSIVDRDTVKKRRACLPI